MSVQFPNLFSPIKIGSKTVKNRIVSTGHQTGYAADNMITDRYIAYHRERAKGGAGLMLIGPLAIDLAGSFPMTPSIFDDKNMASY